MVTTTTHYTDFRYRAYPGEGYDGIVRVSYGGYYGTGTLLFDGLTAAHLFEGSSGSASVSFETPSGTQSFSANKILRHPDYDNQSNNDLAIVWLSIPASVGANRYNIYRSSDEIGQSFTILGYGQTGLGSTGATGEGDDDVVLRVDEIDLKTIVKNLVDNAIRYTPAGGRVDLSLAAANADRVVLLITEAK